MRLSGGGLWRSSWDVVTLAVGRYGQFVVTLVTLPLIARNTNTEQFGLYAIGTALYFFGSVFCDWGLSLPLGSLTKGSSPRAIRIIRSDYLRLRLQLLCAALVLTGVFIAFGGSSIVAAGFVAGCLSSLGEDWLLIASGRFLASVGCQWAGRVVYLGGVFVAVPMFKDPMPVFLALGASSIITVFVNWCLLGIPRLFRPQRVISAKRMLSMGLPAVLAKLVTNLYGIGLSAFLAVKVPVAVVGIYSGGDRVIRAVAAALDSFVIAQFPRIARRVNTSGMSWMILLQVVAVAAATGAFFAAVIWISAPGIVSFLYGDALSGAVDVLRCTAFLIPASALTSTINTNIFNSQQRTLPILIVAITGCVVTLGSVALWSGELPPAAIGWLVVAGEWAAAIMAISLAVANVGKARKVSSRSSEFVESRHS